VIKINIGKGLAASFRRFKRPNWKNKDRSRGPERNWRGPFLIEGISYGAGNKDF